MDDRNRNLNKTSDPKDCPDVVKAMWDAHIYTTNQASVAADIQSKFAGKYKCVVLDKLRPDLAGLLASEDVYQWRGGGKTHLFFYFLFDKQDDKSVKPDLLNEMRLRFIFEPLEAAEPNGGSFTRSGVGVRNNNKRKESTRVREVCSNCQFFLAKQVHFHLASRLSKFRVKTRNRKVSKELGNGQSEGRRDRIRLASGDRKWTPAGTGIWKTSGKPGTG